MTQAGQAQALYRRWRPQTFSEVSGQEHITQTLRNAVATGRLAHAFLFTGPRGTGKTSVARILAKAVNCTSDGEKPCNACSICVSMTEGRSLDLIEIDAASNTGVDDVRDLREKIAFAPNEARYKVYIVDETHMLSSAAFNALLKTLEEPPRHAMFILATTEPHKVPDTIVSRCQRHDFRRVATATVVEKLAEICAAEGMEADEHALAIVARAATGSLRDAESLLDQLMATGGAITLELVRDVLGSSTDEAVADLVDALVARDAAAGLGRIHDALDRGADPRQLQVQILEHLRSVLLVQTGMDVRLLDVAEDRLARLQAQAAAMPPSDLVRTIHLFNEARPTADQTHPSLPLELAVVESILPPTVAVGAPQDVAGAVAEIRHAPPVPAPEGRSEPQRRSEPEHRSGQGRRSEPGLRPDRPSSPPDRRPGADARGQTMSGAPPQRVDRRNDAGAGPPTTAHHPAAEDEGIASTPPSESAAPPSGALSAPGAGLAHLQRHWDQVVAAVQRKDRQTAALLRDCRPVDVSDSTVTLGFFYEFHCQRVADPKRGAVVAEAIGASLGGPRRLVCTVVAPSTTDRSARPRTVADQASTDPVVRHAIDELGARVAGVRRTPGPPE